MCHAEVDGQLAFESIRYTRRRANIWAQGVYAPWAFVLSDVNQKVAVLIDGGHLRSHVRKANKPFIPDYVEKIARSCALPAEVIHRILYYDCRPFEGEARMPVSGLKKSFSGSDKFLHQLSHKDLFAVRIGILKFRGFVLKKSKIPFTPTGPLADDDFEAKFEQKGVDMRIGLDMATLSATRAVELIALVTNDTDCIPAMKHARRAGLQVALIVVPGYRPAPELLAHSDFRRDIPWPVLPSSM
jgi:uncharacterized LabA/DUF88 family protein